MDAGHPLSRGGNRCEHVALVLQGGGALGAYQGGVFQAMDEAGIAPDWVCGVSIGAINSAIIAGNAPADRLTKLRGFWERITPDRMAWPAPDGDLPRQWANDAAAFGALVLGQPGFFSPNLPGPLLSLPGARQATAFYDTTPLRQSLLEFVDFDRLNSGAVRCAVGAVNVASGNFAYFDNAEMTLAPEHIMASGALPPGFPMVQVGTEFFWDGALISNTPLAHLLLNIDDCNTLVFQVDLFSARGPIPRTIQDVGLRQKEIGFSSRTRLVTDYFKREFALKNRLRKLLDRMPPALLTAEDEAERERLRELPQLSILELIYEHTAYEGESRDFEFSRRSMNDHWTRGYNQTRQTLARRDWLEMPGEAGIVTHDIDRG
ncbi:patatin-like phospholipase family protein [Acidisoma sp.]|uniref:patatin-like phospholipase family protein n=1 Tax=Acidisoma sp. TaxID=1872115 RepID=UPI003AFF90FA